MELKKILIITSSVDNTVSEGSALRASLGMTSRVSFGTLRKGTREAVRATYCNDMPQSAAY